MKTMTIRLCGESLQRTFSLEVRDNVTEEELLDAVECALEDEREQARKTDSALCWISDGEGDQ